MVDEQQQYQPSSTNSNSLYSRGLDPSAIKYRLDNEPMLVKMELYLRSARIQGKQVGEEYVEEMIGVANPLANEDGIQAIMGYLQMTIGAHNVQGNFTRDEYKYLVFEIDEYLSRLVFIKCDDWGINENDVDLILDNIMTTVQAFLSRTIDNQERISYGQSMVTNERSVIGMPEKKGLFKTIFGGL